MPHAAPAQSPSGSGSASEALVKKWYHAWETKDVATFDAMLADDFTFTSPARDDHISKAMFKRNCWDTQVAFIQKFDLELVLTRDDVALVKYLCHVTNGKSFRNIEYIRFAGGKIDAIECYFGGNMTYPSAVGSK